MRSLDSCFLNRQIVWVLKGLRQTKEEEKRPFLQKMIFSYIIPSII